MKNAVKVVLFVLLYPSLRLKSKALTLLEGKLMGLRMVGKMVRWTGQGLRKMHIGYRG